MIFRLFRSIMLPVLIGALVAGCSVLRPLPDATTAADRLAAFPTDGLPLERPVTVYWDEHQIPFIEAETDRDLAFTLGLVHAHLRLAQMDLLRRIAKGRISELAGPMATEIDHSLRILDYPRAAASMEERLPSETRAWLEAFAAGVNHYQDQLRSLPHEYHVLDMERETWTVRDLLTIGRLAGTDVNWLAWFRFLRLNDREDWPELWNKFVRVGSDSLPSFAENAAARELENILGGMSRSGSNSFAVSAARSATGGALMANDPHLGIQFPNLWLIVGVKSPDYHAVGLMVPGLPFIALGRNERIAWGGTNMRAASSDLYDISHLPPEQLTRRAERIGVRWWFDRTVVVRDSPHGPVISDAPVLDTDGRTLAVRWVGHERGDEVTAMLRVMRARNWRQFHDAFETFAVSAQNMIYADVDGNVGQLMAIHLPRRGNGLPDDFILDPRNPRNLWRGFATVSDLPSTYNPERGYVASANNRPTSRTETPVGYIFSPDDRIARLHQLLDGTGRLDFADMRRIQLDVYMPSSAALRDAYVERLAAAGIDDLSADEVRALQLMREWHGAYEVDAAGPVAFEAFHAAFLDVFYGRQLGEQDAAAYTSAGRIKQLVIGDMAEARPEILRAALRAGVEAAARSVERFANWGEMHRLGLAHPLSFAPVIGDRYRFGDLPTSGSTDSLMKTAHPATGERHFTFYGQQARHISDLSDPDRNYFTLLGGQDGWIGSQNALDQIDLWQRGDYVQVPLRIDTVRERFDRVMRLAPDS